MIDRIVIENFKSLRKVDLSLGRVNLFIGTNASGKSNFLEALRVLEGIGNGFTMDEILNGKPKGSATETWIGIRGGSAYACFSNTDTGNVRIEANGTLNEPSPEKWEYGIDFFPKEEHKVNHEYIKIREFDYEHDKDIVRNIGPALPFLGTFTKANWEQISPTLPKYDLSMLAPVVVLAKSLSNTQCVDLWTEEIRSYSQSEKVFRMGNHGENFAALIKMICQDKKAKDDYLTWLRHLRPEEVDDVGTRPGAVGEPMFMLTENGREFPAPVLSDGTLRFAALAAAFFQPDMPGIITIEEIENGIHASRIQLLLELFRTQAEATKTQIFATTHSPVILDWLQEEDYKTTFLCARNESTGESRIRSLADVPHFMDVIKKTPASELFSEGWFEAMS